MTIPAQPSTPPAPPAQQPGISLPPAQPPDEEPPPSDDDPNAPSEPEREIAHATYFNTGHGGADNSGH